MAIYQLANLTSSNNTFTGTNTFNKTIVGPVYESYLTWGGKNFSGSYGPLDASMVPELGANRFMFLKAAGITVEYSTNGGSSWSDYGATDSQKVALFSCGNWFTVGKASSSSPATASSQLRVTIDTGNAGIYTVLNKFCIYLSTSGSSGSQVKIQKALQSTPSNFEDVTTAGLSGWSGYNIINVPDFATYGNTESSQYGRIRFIFTITSQNSSYAGLSISKIMGFGGAGWTCPSTMAYTGHLYSYNANQDATFPAKVTATSFVGSLSGNATSATSATKATQDASGNVITDTYLNKTASTQSVAAKTTFSNNTASSSVSTGAVIISNGGLGVKGNIYGGAVYGAVWNDLADAIPVNEEADLDYGYCYCFDGKKYFKSEKYLNKGIIGIHSDTYGFKMGEKKNCKEINVAVAGFVLAYVDKEYESGTPLTCTINGYLTEMLLEDKVAYPERLIGTYWKPEPEEEWGSEDRKVPVNGRHWIKIK